MSLVSRYGPYALITGAAQGIGAEFARQLAMHGFNLVLVDIQAEKVEKVAALLRKQYGVVVKPIVLNLMRDDFMDVLAPQLTDLDVGLLINNAGRWETGAFVTSQLSTMADNTLLNVRAPLVLAGWFGRKFTAQKRGGMIFLSSISAFQGTPRLANYCATKAYNMRLAESLWSELGPQGVDVLALAPGLTHTPALRRSGLTKLPGMQYTHSAEVVTAALNTLGKRPVLIVGWRNKLTIFLNRFASRRLALAITARVMSQK